MNIAECKERLEWYDFTPLEPRLRKKYNELLALAVLRYHWPEKYNDYIPEDGPDLQCTDGYKAVEVTEAVLTRDAIIDGNYDGYQRTFDLKKKEKRIKEIIKQGGTVDELGISYPPTNSAEEYSMIQDVITKKHKKIEQYKANGFESLELAVIMNSLMIPVSESKLRNLLGGPVYALRFESVFLCNGRILFRYVHEHDSLDWFEMSSSDYDCIKNIVRFTVDGKYSVNDSVWK